ncbi:unnamed protein product [Hapterophycus canaliculatus]
MDSSCPPRGDDSYDCVDPGSECFGDDGGAIGTCPQRACPLAENTPRHAPRPCRVCVLTTRPSQHLPLHP